MVPDPRRGEAEAPKAIKAQHVLRIMTSWKVFIVLCKSYKIYLNNRWHTHIYIYILYIYI
jgi:hypothetical protein